MEIFVGCSCAENIDEKYMSVARELGNLIVENAHSLLFGSSDAGLMGELYRTVKQLGGKVTAVLPEKYRGFLKNVDASNTIKTVTASEQLKFLVTSGDLTIIMPGSFGTLSELIVSIYLKKLGEHNKPIYILNSFGYYDELLALFDKIYEENFDFYDRKSLFKVVSTPKEIFEDLKVK